MDFPIELPYFCTELPHFCIEFTKNCISLSQSDSRNFFMYIIKPKIVVRNRGCIAFARTFGNFHSAHSFLSANLMPGYYNNNFITKKRLHTMLHKKNKLKQDIGSNNVSMKHVQYETCSPCRAKFYKKTTLNELTIYNIKSLEEVKPKILYSDNSLNCLAEIFGLKTFKT